eukprot:365272-Chlamydomonas_euryale.AAC.17
MPEPPSLVACSGRTPLTGRLCSSMHCQASAFQNQAALQLWLVSSPWAAARFAEPAAAHTTTPQLAFQPHNWNLASSCGTGWGRRQATLHVAEKGFGSAAPVLTSRLAG